MRTRKQELVSDDLKPFVCNIMKEYREKYNYSLEDLARALNYKKNRQTLHKYETGTLNIPYEIFFDIANIFNINSDVFDEIPMTKDEKDLFEKKMIRSYVNTMTGNNNITSRGEKIVNSYRNASYEPVSKMCDLSIKLMDDSMAPIYLKGDRVFFRKKDGYNSGEWIFKPKGETDSTGTLTVYVENEELEASGQAVIDVIPRIHYQIIQIGGQDAHAAQTSLGQMEPIKFKITADAEALDRAAIDALKTKPTLAVKMTDSSFFIWKTGEKRNGISGRWYIEDDGTCVYQPKGLSWFYGTGEVALTLSEEASCTAVFTIEERSFLYWIPIGFVLFSLFLLWCIIGWIRQPKFNNQIMEIVVYTKFGSAIQESPRIKVMKRRIGLIPYRACRMRVGDLVFIAAPGRKIVLDKDCVRGRVVYSGKVRFMGRSAGNMKRLLRMMEPAKRDVRMVRGMELYVAPDKNAQALTGYRITG